jgi:hypothetical protein
MTIASSLRLGRDELPEFSLFSGALVAQGSQESLNRALDDGDALIKVGLVSVIRVSDIDLAADSGEGAKHHKLPSPVETETTSQDLVVFSVKGNDEIGATEYLVTGVLSEVVAGVVATLGECLSGSGIDGFADVPRRGPGTRNHEGAGELIAHRSNP